MAGSVECDEALEYEVSWLAVDRESDSCDSVVCAEGAD